MGMVYLGLENKEEVLRLRVEKRGETVPRLDFRGSSSDLSDLLFFLQHVKSSIYKCLLLVQCKDNTFFHFTFYCLS